MSFLFDFGISQEDPLSELRILDLKPNDRILSVASGGEVPLAFLSLCENIKLSAVDISESQIMLCRFKLLASLHLNFPMNGRFLGYAALDEKKRIDLYREIIMPQLSEKEILFWNKQIHFIAMGIVNAGRFEQYMRKMRFIAKFIVGKNNINQLIDCQSTEDQKKVFYELIAPRKSLQLLFKVAFHPMVYKKRGLQEQALIHAGKTTGDRFFSKFEDFCTSTLAAENYFLQYFLAGTCSKEESFPEYLQPVNRIRLINNLKYFELTSNSLQDALREKEKGHYNKVHASNIGDWLSDADFAELLNLFKTYCNAGTKICYRYLQKNHLQKATTIPYSIDTTLSREVEKLDRFPFYNILSVTLQGEAAE